MLDPCDPMANPTSSSGITNSSQNGLSTVTYKQTWNSVSYTTSHAADSSTQSEDTDLAGLQSLCGILHLLHYHHLLPKVFDVHVCHEGRPLVRGFFHTLQHHRVIYVIQTVDTGREAE